MNQFSRTQLLLGAEAMEKLRNSNVAVFGIGGVGSYTVEALARGGIGSFALFDSDIVCESNINRQLIATYKTLGKAKVDVMRDRISDINPAAQVAADKCLYNAENADDYDFSRFSYIVDAIDTISSKLILIQKAKEADVPIISCMGAGNKLEPTMLEVSDIYKTSVCPLAKVMRKELKARGISSLKVVYSKEIPVIPVDTGCESCRHSCPHPPEEAVKCIKRRQAPGSVSFVPSAAGLIIAGEVIKDLILRPF